MKTYICILALGFIFAGCNENYKNERDIFLLDIKNSFIVDTQLIINKMEIVYSDSILIKSTYGDKTIETIFYKKGDDMYEYRHTQDANRQYKIDSILTLSLKDTMFIYNSYFDFPLYLFQFPLTSSEYKIQKKDNFYTTIRKSLIDTTYKEIYFYNEDFKIYKFINLYKNNKYVYVKK